MAWSPLPSPASRGGRRALLLLAPLAVVTACGNSQPGVTVTNAQSDVVFAGAKPSTAPAAEPVPGTQEGQPIGPPPVTFPSAFPSLRGFDNNTPPFQFPSPGSSTAPETSRTCPGPPIGSTAPEAATTFVQGQPKPGFYLWQLLTTEDLGNNIKSTKAKYTNYEITNVSKVTTRPNPNGEPTSTFTYDVVAPGDKGTSITYTIQVKQNAQGASVSTGNLGKPQRVAEPDAGVAIAKEVLRGPDGKVMATFAPTPPVLILPLPVQGGADFTGAGTDPRTGASLQVRGTVKGPDRVTGCSEFIQGIRADATVSSRGAPSQVASTVDEVFTVETQKGGIIVGTAQTPLNSKITSLTVVGENSPSPKPRDIPKEQRP